MRLPPVTLLRAFDTHRLIPSKHLPKGDSVLAVLADDDDDLPAIFALDDATNDRWLAEARVPSGIGVEERVFGLPRASVVNAAFCHPHPLGSRFNGPDRGAWYAALELPTAQAEVGFHKTAQLAEIGRFEDSVTYDDYVADFSAGFHDLRAPRGFRACLNPDSYVASQTLADGLLEAGSLAVVYPSARRENGTSLACFRPALVMNVRRARTYQFTWEGTPDHVVTAVRRS